MPSFLLEDTTTSATFVISGTLPLDATNLVPIGTYSVYRLSDPAEDLLDVQGVSGQITANQSPIMSELYAGQSVQDITGYDTFVSSANFVSSAGVVRAQDITVTVQGDAPTSSTTLDEGQSVGFTVTVTDSVGSAPVSFVAEPIVVDYKLRLPVGAENTLSIDINPLVPGHEPVDVTVTTEPWASRGVWPVAVARDDIDAGPVNVVAPSFGFNTTNLGGALTVEPGLWLFEAALATPTTVYTLCSDGVDVPGFASVDLATINSYTITAAEQGTALHVVATTTDANGTRSVPIPGVAIPAPAVGLSVDQIYQAADNESGSTASPTFTVDLSAYGIGSTLLVLLGCDVYSSGLTVAGSAATRLGDNQSTNPPARGEVEAYAFTLTAPGSSTTTLRPNKSGSTSLNLAAVYAIQNGVIDDVDFESTGGSAAVGLSVTPSGAVNQVISFGSGHNAAVNGISWSGGVATTQTTLGLQGSYGIAVGARQDVPAGAPFGVTATPGGADDLGHILVAISET